MTPTQWTAADLVERFGPMPLHRVRHDFDAGVRLVWYVYPGEREVHVYSTPNEPKVLVATSTLDGGEVLPGFELDLRTLFANRLWPVQAGEYS